MGDSTVTQWSQSTTRRAFLKQVFAFTGVSAGAALLNACGAPGATATAVPPAAQQPTTLATSAPAATTAATVGAASTPTSGAAPTGEATVEGCYSARNTIGSPLSVRHRKRPPGSGNGAGTM
jgi:hypothetical protein